ncbi:hypothetical protein H8959_005894, partial [Pygathrix nigripes]
WVHGDPRRAAYPTDSQGHFCGQKGTPNENKTILFYFNLLRCTSPSVLLNLQCPTTQENPESLVALPLTQSPESTDDTSFYLSSLDTTCTIGNKDRKIRIINSHLEKKE